MNNKENNIERLMDFTRRLCLFEDLGHKIDFCNKELEKLEKLAYIISINKNLSTKEKKIQTDELYELYEEINIIFNKYSDEHFENFKKEILSNLERFPNDINIKYLNGLLENLKDDVYENDEDKSVEIFLNNELRKQKIKKILND